MTNSRVFLAICPAFALIVVPYVAYLLSTPSEAEAIGAFLSFHSRYSGKVSEGELMDPLIACRGDVIPRVIRSVPTMPMPMRHYAMGFLGNQGDRRALPLLRAMFTDDAEIDLLRGEALSDIALIDRVEGLKLATSFRGRGEFVSFSAKEITRSEFAEHRTRSRAVWNLMVKRLGLD